MTSTADILTVARDRIARVFDKSGNTPCITFDLIGFSKLLLLMNLRLTEVQVEIQLYSFHFSAIRGYCVFICYFFMPILFVEKAVQLDI